MPIDPRRLGEPASKGAHLLDPEAGSRRRALRRQRLIRFVKRPWIWGAATFTAVSALIAFLNTSLDLFEHLDQSRDHRQPPLIGAANPNGPDDLILWNEEFALCGDGDSREPLARAPIGSDDVQAGEGDLGSGAASGPFAPTSPWALADVYHVPASAFEQRDFVAAGATVVGERIVEVILSNRREHDIIVTDLTADIVERRPPFRGTLMYPRGGDAVPVIQLLLDLAEAEPVAMTLDDLCDPYPFFARYKLAIEAGRAEILSIMTRAADCHCRYRLRIEYWYDGKRHVETVPTDGEQPLVSLGHSPSGYDVIYTLTGMDVTRHDCRADPAACADELAGPD